MAESPRRAAPAGGAGGRIPPQLPKEEALRRLHVLKRGVTVASMVSFGALSGVIALRPAGASTTSATATTQHETSPVLAAVASATATPASTATPTVTATVTATTTPTPSATATATATKAAPPTVPLAGEKAETVKAAHKHATTRKAAATATPTATATPSATATATATPAATATATPAATATPLVTATPQSSFMSQGQGGYSVGSSTQSPPATQSGAS